VKPWYLYLVRCRDGTLYTGISSDVGRRLAEHRAGKGARYLRGRAPLVLARKVRIGPVGDALKIERKVKRMSPARKEKLIAGKIRLKDLIEKDVRRQTSDVSKKKIFKNRKAGPI
jgi:putative endonuclease